MKKIFLLFILFFPTCSVKKELPKDTLFIVLDSRPETLDPRRAVSANGMRIVDLLFGSFVKTGDKGQLEPDLALQWELKGLVWTFKLKPGLKFSNGRMVSKEDILFSFEEFKNNSSFSHAFKNIQSVKVLENKEKQFIVKVFLKKFQAPFISSDLPVLKILPKQESSSKDFFKHPVGTGDWKVIENSFRRVFLKRNTLSSSQSLNFLSFQIIRDSLTRTQKMLSKEIDLAPSVIPANKLSSFKKKDEEFNIFSTAGFSTTYLLINLKNDFLKLKELRQALSFAINSKEIIKYKIYGYAVPARSFINPENFFFNKNLPFLKYNLHKAKEIIKRLNLTGQSFTISSSNSSDTLVKSKVLASQISQTGLKISVHSSEWGAFYKDVGRGNFDLALMKWVGVKDPDIYRIAFHSDNQAPKGRNRSFYSNKTIDQLLEKGLRERDPFKRKIIYDQIQAIILKDKIVIPLWHDMEVSVLKSNIENYHIRPNGDFLSLPYVTKK